MSSDKFSFWLSLSRFYPGNCRLCGHVDWNRCRTSIGYYSIGVMLETKAETHKTLAFRFVFSCLHQKSKLWYGMVWYGVVWYGMVWYGMVWYGMVWYGMVWYGMIGLCHAIAQ